ncbi:MAG: glycoside hydrolase family 27 protein [Bacteroidales bacterium]|nr:glycoside hydrolase family 27 protein [Bacteroidales bacterium]
MKKTVRIWLLLAAVLLPAAVSAQKWEGVAETPQMGWNSWNKFASRLNEQLVRETADAMVSEGLLDAGYVYLNMDDCWHGPRDADGFITCDATKFPSGIKAVADYVHSKGLKFGIYSDAGRKTCAGFPGSFGHEYQDAIQYARWGVDYLKYDWCSSEDINPRGAYALMRDALREAGRPIFFSMCEWGSNEPWLWAAEVGHSWRTTGDIAAVFDARTRRSWENSVMTIVERNVGLRKYAGPGHWNDPDMLEVGNGMTVNEDRAHFTLWCMMASPLILGNDICNMTQETRDIILNKDVIAIDQDPLGVQGLRLKVEDSLQFWFKPLADGAWAFCLFNRGRTPVEYTVDWQTLCFTDTEVSGLSTEFDKKRYEIKNLWEKTSKKKAKAATTAKPLRVTVPGRDVVLYRLTPLQK